MEFSQVRWKRVSIAIGIGLVAVLGATTAYAKYQLRQGVCVKYYPDGSEKMFYGKDCGEPFQSVPPTPQGEDI